MRYYYLRPSMRPEKCIVDNCTMVPTRWSCLCDCHYMRWYHNGSFERSRVELRWLRELGTLPPAVDGIAETV